MVIVITKEKKVKVNATMDEVVMKIIEEGNEVTYADSKHAEFSSVFNKKKTIVAYDMEKSNFEKTNYVYLEGMALVAISENLIFKGRKLKAYPLVEVKL